VCGGVTLHYITLHRNYLKSPMVKNCSMTVNTLPVTFPQNHAAHGLHSVE